MVTDRIHMSSLVGFSDKSACFPFVPSNSFGRLLLEDSSHCFRLRLLSNLGSFHGVIYSGYNILRVSYGICILA